MVSFFTVSNRPRPVRLCEETRQFAYDSLDHVYGLDTAKTHAIALDDIEGFENMSPTAKYNAAIRAIAEKAPVRICKNEKISGAATLGMAISHLVPVTYRGEQVFYSVSHLTIDYETVLKTGLRGIRNKVVKALEKPRDARGKEFLESALSVLDSFDIWHGRYIKALENMPGYENNLKNLRNVPKSRRKISMRQFSAYGSYLLLRDFAETGLA